MPAVVSGIVTDPVSVIRSCRRKPGPIAVILIAAMQSALILILFHLGAAVRALALWRAIAAGVFLRYPAFLAMTLFACGRALVVIALGGGTGRVHPYFEIWTATQSLMLFLEAAAAIEAFWILAVHFRKMQVYGTVLLALMIAISALGAWWIARWGGNWQSPLNTLVLAAQHIAFGSLVLVLLALVWFRQPTGFPIRPNAVRHAWVLLTLFGTSFLGSFLIQVSHSRWGFAANLIITAGAFLAYAAWALRITRSGESLPFQPPPPLTQDQFDEAEASERAAADRLRRAGSEALSKALRSSDI